MNTKVKNFIISNRFKIEGAFGSIWVWKGSSIFSIMFEVSYNHIDTAGYNHDAFEDASYEHAEKYSGR